MKHRQINFGKAECSPIWQISNTLDAVTVERHLSMNSNCALTIDPSGHTGPPLLEADHYEVKEYEYIYAFKGNANRSSVYQCPSFIQLKKPRLHLLEKTEIK
jgi:hypothetical protein